MCIRDSVIGETKSMIFVLINSVLVLSTRHKIKIRVRHTNIKVVIGMLHDLDLWGLDLLAIFLINKLLTTVIYHMC